jgi:hypothetical protein
VSAGAAVVLVGGEYIIADYKRRLDVSLSLDICDGAPWKWCPLTMQ